MLLSGSLNNAAVVVDLINHAPGSVKGTVHVKVFASLTPSLDANSTLINSIISTQRIKAMQSLAVAVPLTFVPVLPEGDYYLVAKVIDPNGNVTTGATSTTTHIAPPFVQLSETLDMPRLTAPVVGGSKTGATARVHITNNGNILASETLNFVLGVSPTPGGAPVATVPTHPRDVNIRPGGTLALPLPLWTIPIVATGEYYFVVEVTEPTGGMSSAATSGTVNIAAPFIALAARFASLGANVITSGAAIIVLNNGNSPDLTHLTYTLGFSTDAAGTVPAGSTQTATMPARLNIPASSRRQIHVPGWKSLESTVATGPYFLTALIADDSSNTALAVSSMPINVA